MPQALVCRDVTLRHGQGFPPVLTGVSFALEEGERVALLGLNGSGKTSLLRALVGLMEPEGEITVCGRRLGPATIDDIRQRVGFLFNVPEDQLLFAKVIDDVAFGLLRTGVGRQEASRLAHQVLERLGIDHLADHSVHQLSHGEKLRVALAGALVTNPSVLLLDEPTAGLDPPGASALAHLLTEVKSAQLIATHDLGFAEQVCSRAILLERGRIIPDVESPGDVRKRWELQPAP